MLRPPPSIFQEVIGYDERFEKSKTHGMCGYVGLEPSGDLHLGHLVLIKAINWLESQNIRMIILIADIHGRMNDKGSEERIRQTSAAMIRQFRDLGLGSAEFKLASELIDSRYMSLLVTTCYGISLSRFRRTLTIQGREESYLNENPLSLLYAMMQLTDVFALEVDVCLAGLDQRRIYVLAREIASRRKKTAPALFHISLLNDLKNKGKMSKSVPERAIFLDDTEEEISRKIKKAYLSPENNDSPLFQIVELLLTGSLRYQDENLSIEDIKKQNLSGKLDPQVFKTALAKEIFLEIQKFKS